MVPHQRLRADFMCPAEGAQGRKGAPRRGTGRCRRFSRISPARRGVAGYIYNRMTEKRSLGKPLLRAGDLVIRGGKLLQVVFGNAGPRLAEVTGDLVGVVEVVRHFKLSGLMIVTRWIRAGCPHVVIGKRRFFRIGEVVGWLANKGYLTGELRAGKGLLAARRRGKKVKWRKGAMKPTDARNGAAVRKGGKEKARDR